jgi:hypothetical protein
LTDTEFRGAWGGHKGGASAYMLMYRYQDGDDVMSTSTSCVENDVPMNIRKIVAEEDAKYQKERVSMMSQVVSCCSLFAWYAL